MSSISPWDQFKKQRSNAKQRGIEWNLTFDEWWKVWLDSGCYHARGKRGFVMHRRDNDGAYEVGNVTIVTAVENFMEAMDY